VPNLEQKRKADAFLGMHAAAQPLLLANVWDVSSARIIEQAGFPAIATTSAGIAFSRGYPDGQKIDADRMIAAIAEITEAVRVPVTADVESGYGATPERVSRTARNVIMAGAVGMNFEDATGDPAQPLADLSLQLERIRAIRESAEQLQVRLVLNARTDVYLLEVGQPAKRYDHTLQRLHAFREAGADCLFAPGLQDQPTIGRLVADLHGPVNILAVKGSPSISELTALGVKRVSLGSGPMRATLGLLRRIAKELRSQGTYTAVAEAPSYAEMNALMSSNRETEN
jgi:2-methylisocitrate lyase-like PEP mutase family enzyme